MLVVHSGGATSGPQHNTHNTGSASCGSATGGTHTRNVNDGDANANAMLIVPSPTKSFLDEFERAVMATPEKASSTVGALVKPHFGRATRSSCSAYPLVAQNLEAQLSQPQVQGVPNTLQVKVIPQLIFTQNFKSG